MFALLSSRCANDAINRGIHFIYGLPNHQALPGWLKRGNADIVSTFSVKSLVIPLDVKPLVQQKTHWLIGYYASSLVFTLVFFYLMFIKTLHRDPNGTIEKAKGIPEDWDSFWQEAKGSFDFILVRDRRALIWRYFQSPNKYHLYIRRESGKITAYIVTRIISDTKMTSLVIADYLTLPGREGDIKMLLFRALDDAMKIGVTKMVTWCIAEGGYFDVFKSCGFIERSEIPVISFQNDFARTLQENCRRWHFTISDSDNV
jgi:hypothetical protein